MTISELDLLVRSIHREWVQDPSKITYSNNSVFYMRVKFDLTNKIHLYYAKSCSEMWPTIGLKEFVCDRPWFIFYNDRAKWDAIMQLFLEMTGEAIRTGTEEVIVDAVPSAKEIIAERALLGDHVKN